MPEPLTPPPDWVRVDSDLDGVNYVVVEPGREDGFRSNFVVTASQVTTESFGDWQIATDVLFDETLERYQLIDLEKVEIAGKPGGRRLAHHAGPNGEALTLEQWFVLTPGVGHTLSATVETSRYDEFYDTIGQVASTWDPEAC